jgi:O-antigen/teichoic acid export membrane protein
LPEKSRHFSAGALTSLISAASMVYAQVVTALFGAFLGAFLGAANYGVVNLARTIFVVALVATPLGLDLALQRSLGRGDVGKAAVAGEVNWLRLAALGVSAALALGALLGGAAALEKYVFHYHDIGWALIVTMAALPFATDMNVLGGAYRGLFRPAPSLIATYVVQPTARMAAIFVLFLFTDRVSAAIIGTSLSYVLSGLLLAALALRDFPLRTLGRPDALARARGVLAYSPVLGATTLILTFARSLDTMTLAHFAPSVEVGRYAVVLLVGQLVAVIGASLGQTLGTRVAAAAHAGDRAGIARLLRENMSLASILCAPFCLAIALWGRDIDLLLGHSYVIPLEVFAVASVGQWIMTTTHYSSYALSLTGRHQTELFNNIVALGVQAVGCLVLIPRYGMLGAAVSTSLSALAINILRQGQIARMLGESIFSLRLLAPLALSALVAAPLFLLGREIGFRAWWLTGLLAGGEVVASFALILSLLASPAQKQALARLILRRRGEKAEGASAK